MAIDYGTDQGRVRLLTSDIDEVNLLLTDEQVQTLLNLEAGNVRLAAAQALDIIASSEVLVAKVIRTQDVATDGARVAAELRARATELRRQAAEGDGTASAGLEIVDFDPWAGWLGAVELAEGAG